METKKSQPRHLRIGWALIYTPKSLSCCYRTFC